MTSDTSGTESELPVQEPTESLAEQVLRTVPDLDALLSGGNIIPPGPMVRALVGAAPAFGEEALKQMSVELELERQQLLTFARQAIEALRQGQRVRVPLTEEEQRGMEAILTFVARPALQVQNNIFVEPPAMWQKDLSDRRKLIQRTLPAVGRIDVGGHPDGLTWVGTGWVAAPGLLMTNRHVVKQFAAPDVTDGTRWHIKPNMTARIDFAEDHALADEQRVYDIPDDALIRVHPDYDLALVPVAQTARGSERRSLPAPLVIASRGEAIAEGRKVYVVGYPARDNNNREYAAMYRLFDALFDVKRLQPGQVMQFLPEKNIVLHDCSTLGGNSGSCVVDLITNQVIGLHYAGFHRHANFAVALWKLADDALLREAGVHF